eukprot:2249194-Pleurochrysis_carterae.AAC.6
MKPPRMEPVPPPRLQPVKCYAQKFDSPHELLTPRCLQDLQAWLDTLLDDLVTMRDAHDTRMRPQPFVRGQLCFVPKARGCVWDLCERSCCHAPQLHCRAGLAPARVVHSLRPTTLAGCAYAQLSRARSPN